MMVRYAKTAMAILLVAALAAGAGCGGGKKKKTSDRAGSPEGTLAGKVDVLNGFGADAGRGDLVKKIRGEVMVRLYRMQPGGGLVPVSEVQPRPLSGESFSLEKVPLEERNLVVRLEKSEGEIILAAIAPPVGQDAGYVIVSPETDLEAAVLARLVKEGVREPEDVKPADVDAALIKDIVGPELFFDLEKPPEKEAALKTLLPAARHAYVKYVENLVGPGAAAGDEKMGILVSYMAGPEMKIRIREDRRQAATDAERAERAQALGKALGEVNLSVDALSPEAIWWISGEKARLAAARCLASPKEGGCPPPAEGAANLTEYGAVLMGKLIKNRGEREAVARAEALFPQTATGARRLPPVQVVEKLMNLPPDAVEQFRAAALDAARRQDAEDFKLVLSDLRDVVVTGALGMPYSEAERIYSAAYKEAQGAGNTAAEPNVDMKQTGHAHQQFISAQSTVFQPLCVVLKTRFPKLEETDSKKLCRALAEIIMYATVHDLPSVMFFTRDTDSDMVPDNVEAALGTDTSDRESVPAEVLTATPASMLPPAPPDADRDGFYDSVETVAGTDPESAASKPRPGRIRLCGKEGPVCPPAKQEKEDKPAPIAGVVEYKLNPMAGATVGLYDKPDFSGRPPLAKSDPTGADGVFSVQAPADGGYFVVAFTDADGDGAPGRGEAVGAYGGVYPRRVAPGRQKGRLLVEMSGVLGAARCEEGKFYDPVLRQCAGECPAGFAPDTLTAECSCAEDRLFVEPEGKCGKECPAGTVENRVRRGCFCPEGTLADRDRGKCACPAGMALDEKLNKCRCGSGFLYAKTMICMERCPETFKADRETGTCVCPAGAAPGADGARCECATGYYDPVDVKCVSQCAYGMRPGQAGMCACGENETFDEGKKNCECVPGMERTAQGGCSNPPAPPKTQAPAQQQPAGNGEQPHGGLKGGGLHGSPPPAVQMPPPDEGTSPEEVPADQPPPAFFEVDEETEPVDENPIEDDGTQDQ